MKSKVSDHEFTILFYESLSIAQLLRKLKLAPVGGNYKTMVNRIKKLNLDKSHMTGQLWSKGKIIGPKVPISEYLDNNRRIGSHSLKHKLLEAKLKESKCEMCQLSSWNNKEMPLELHHIDGNSENNNITNLQVLCPNCHAQTDNYRGKNKPKIPKEIKIARLKKIYDLTCKCGKDKKHESKQCDTCYKTSRSTKITWPDNDKLKELVWSKPLGEIGKDLGVTDNAIIKRCKKLGIERPKLGHWLKANHLPC